MKKIFVPFYVCLVAILLSGIGCSAAVTDEPAVGLSSQALTLAECAAERDECMDRAGLLGLVFCNADYTLCAATADNGLPAQVVDAAAGAAECTAQLDDCVLAASSPSELTACAEAEALCVAEVLDVQLPAIVSGTTACVDGSLECIEEATSVNDLTGCGETLVDCAIEQAGSVIPDEVTEVIGDVVSCTSALDDCILAASSPSELSACAEQEALCVAESLGVELPEIPVSEVVGCAETAADCTLQSESVSDILGCTNGLIDCGQAVVDALEVPQIVDCNVAWTNCMFRNPLAFIQCSRELRECQNP